MSKVRQIIREAITELIDDSRCIDCGYITNEDLRKWFGKGGEVEQPKVVGTDMVQTDKS